MGRVNASMRVLEIGLAAVGALVGGLLGDLVGVRATLLVAALGILASVLWLVRSPVRFLHAAPPAKLALSEAVPARTADAGARPE